MWSPPRYKSLRISSVSFGQLTTHRPPLPIRSRWWRNWQQHTTLPGRHPTPFQSQIAKVEKDDDDAATIEAYRHWIKALSMKVATPHQVQTANEEADRLRVDLRKAHTQVGLWVCVCCHQADLST